MGDDRLFLINCKQIYSFWQMYSNFSWDILFGECLFCLNTHLQCQSCRFYNHPFLFQAFIGALPHFFMSCQGMKKRFHTVQGPNKSKISQPQGNQKLAAMWSYAQQTDTWYVLKIMRVPQSCTSNKTVKPKQSSFLDTPTCLPVWVIDMSL